MSAYNDTTSRVRIQEQELAYNRRSQHTAPEFRLQRHEPETAEGVRIQQHESGHSYRSQDTAAESGYTTRVRIQ
jgi:hypothetical protein